MRRSTGANGQNCHHTWWPFNFFWMWRTQWLSNSSGDLRQLRRIALQPQLVFQRCCSALRPRINDDGWQGLRLRHNTLGLVVRRSNLQWGSFRGRWNICRGCSDWRTCAEQSIDELLQSRRPVVHLNHPLGDAPVQPLFDLHNLLVDHLACWQRRHCELLRLLLSHAWRRRRQWCRSCSVSNFAE